MAGNGNGGATPVESDGWMPARLIPVAGIRGQDEQEIRAASSLLAVMGAVDEFGRTLLRDVGAPAGRISTFTEVPLEAPDGKTLRPDGVIAVERGKTSWRCLVEVKTGNAPLNADRSSDPDVRDVVDRWEQFIEYLCLGLSQDLGVQVTSPQSKDKDGGQWTESLLATLDSEGKLTGSFRVPGAVGPIDVEADLRARLTRANVKVSAPKDGRPLTRINWILRQLGKAPKDLRLEVQFARTKETTALLLADAAENPKALLSPSDPGREPRSFNLSLARPLGTKRGRGERSFVLETRRQVVAFYGGLVENLRDWQPKAPKLSFKEPAEAEDPRRTVPGASDVVQIARSTGDILVALDEPPIDGEEDAPAP
jgi:hypothetical protein